MTTSDCDASIVETVIRLAHCLGLTVVAEGVEGLPQLYRLLEMDCDEVQGFYYTKPLPADGLIEWVETKADSFAV